VFKPHTKNLFATKPATDFMEDSSLIPNHDDFWLRKSTLAAEEDCDRMSPVRLGERYNEAIDFMKRSREFVKHASNSL
jgi:hypothetical protein